MLILSKGDSLHLLTPNSQSIPPPLSPLATTSLFFNVHDFLFCGKVHLCHVLDSRSFNYSFIEIGITEHSNHSFEVYGSVVFSVFTKSCCSCCCLTRTVVSPQKSPHPSHWQPALRLLAVPDLWFLFLWSCLFWTFYRNQITQNLTFVFGFFYFKFCFLGSSAA